MTTIRFLGAGRIGGTLARRAVAAGYDVILSNSRGPETLSELIGQLGPRARAVPEESVTDDAAFVVLAIPMHALNDIDPGPLAGSIVVDANNYFVERDGHIAELEDGTLTTSEYVQRHLVGARIVKAFNHIRWMHIDADARPRGAPDRRALAVSGDDVEAKAPVAEFIDRVGFDVVDLGPLREGRRAQPGTPVFTPRLTVSELRAAAGLDSRDDD